MKNMPLKLRPVAFGLLFLGTTVASASMITLNGTDVTFTYDDTLTGLFGTPTVSGNSLFFTPTTFQAISTNGAGTQLTNANMNVLVTPHTNVTLTKADVQERGDYSLNGTDSAVSAAGALRAFDTKHPFTVSDSSLITTSAPTTTNDNMFHDWTANASLDFSSSDWQKAGPINFTLENVLEATTSASISKAFIDKKFAGIQLGVTGSGVVPPTETVPVPAALWLFGSGLIGLVAVSRRTTATSMSMAAA